MEWMDEHYMDITTYHGAKTVQEGRCLCFILANDGIRILIVRLETKNIRIEIALQGGEADPVDRSVFPRCMPHDNCLQRDECIERCEHF